MRRMLAAMLFVPTLAWAQYDELKPPKPMPWPNQGDLNAIENAGRGPACRYIFSTTALRPGDMPNAVVLVDIAANGTPSTAEVSESSGNVNLDRASKMCALSWHYTLADSSRRVSAQLAIRWRKADGFPPPQGETEFVGRPVFDKAQITALAL